ncbi:MAG: DUF5596 domain-containing protein [Lentisphaeria bacterium]|nr:DUF5596 domain-containing protein [Lentisphaeria bacterium]
MKLQDILTYIGDNIERDDTLAEHWAESVATFPAELPRFLDPESATEAREFASLPVEADRELREAALQIAASPELLHLAWHCQRLLWDHLEYEAEKVARWPLLDRRLGDLSGAFYLLIALEAVSRMRAVHERLGIPEKISRDSCCDYTEKLSMYREHHDGHFGILPSALAWLRHLVRGDLYCLGRHQYMVKPFGGHLKAYRHRQSRRLIALAMAGERFDCEGFAAQTDSPGSWTAGLIETTTEVVGTPISPFGQAVDRELRLPLSEWDLALSPGDMILEVHIPSGGSMTLDRCQDSMRQALEFFPRHFPDTHFVGFATHSWILNPQLEQIYRADSNMVKWQRELYLFPVPSSNQAGVFFVFGKHEIDVNTAPRNTSLRRAFVDHLANGGRLIESGMFMLLEDFASEEDQVYRKQWQD